MPVEDLPAGWEDAQTPEGGPSFYGFSSSANAARRYWTWLCHTCTHNLRLDSVEHMGGFRGRIDSDNTGALTKTTHFAPGQTYYVNYDEHITTYERPTAKNEMARLVAAKNAAINAEVDNTSDPPTVRFGTSSMKLYVDKPLTLSVAPGL